MENFDYKQLKQLNFKFEMLRKALQLDLNKEYTELFILEEVSKHNLKEFPILEYLINITLLAPDNIKKENQRLTNLYDNVEKFQKTYNEIKNLYKYKPEFKKYANKIIRDLELYNNYGCKYTNYIIFELCQDYITDIITLESKNIFFSLHLIQRWINDHKNILLPKLSELEKLILLYLQMGYSINEIIYLEGVENKTLNCSVIDQLIKIEFPKKFCVKSILEVLAILYLFNPNKNSIKSFEYDEYDNFKNILKNL